MSEDHDRDQDETASVDHQDSSEAAEAATDGDAEAAPKKKVRRKTTTKKKTTATKSGRKKTVRKKKVTAAAEADAEDAASDAAASADSDGAAETAETETPKPKRRAPRRRKKVVAADEQPDVADDDEGEVTADADAEPGDEDESTDDEESRAPRSRRGRRRRRRGGSGNDDDEASERSTEAAEDAAEQVTADESSSGESKSSGRRGGRGRKKTRRSERGERSPRGIRGDNSGDVEHSVIGGKEIMIVNDLPGEECRIAILEDGHLEELYAERQASATNVGNIYKGRVVNVEPAIQAAFIDYGQGTNGFLHISDLHPRYFPGGEQVERVGKKIPRRERPAIQDALKRGDGSAGAGAQGRHRFQGADAHQLPVHSRTLARHDAGHGSRRCFAQGRRRRTRREMRKILDTLDLPDGFGFILRTAGIGRTKAEIKRDVAYLVRLWKQIEKRIDRVGAPCELYTESDLVIRTVRDVLRPSIEAIVVDSDSAYERCSAFLRVVAPRSSPKILRYPRRTPIFHAFDIERQIDLIHAREVPLRSGGALVIDQTEALVAIDVNSGRSRSARDSETNAYRTNCEAVDEICRQLRLRDLGGLIVNDLIDMRMMRHRRQIEERIRVNLKRDRARTTVTRISEFGLLEMTRQRMRPSLRKTHFIECPICSGRGEVQAPDSVAADVARQIAFYLDQPRVDRVEIVCSPRVASVLLSRTRRELVRMEGREQQANRCACQR